MMRSGVIAIKHACVSMARVLLAVPAAIVLFVSAFMVSKEAKDRNNGGAKPRLIYGPLPLIGNKYMRQAMASCGYEARTFVYQIYPAHRRDDFDFYLEDFFQSEWLRRRPISTIFDILRPYVVFLWLIRHFDIFHFYFNGGYLATTPLRYLEVQLLHVAGKKVVVMPYGSDVAVPTHIRSLVWRQGLMMNYPNTGKVERETMRSIEYFSRRADFIVGCIFHCETMPRWDLLTTHYYPIDTETWHPRDDPAASERADHIVRVVHAPNHRGLKGTPFLIAACRELQEEGYPVELRLLEGLPNSEVKQAMLDADIVADQFIHGYALTAMEGMSLGKVVMANLSDDHYYLVHRLYTGLDECPIVNTPIEQIKEQLRLLVSDPELRADRARAGREYVLKYHSYAAMGAMWDCIYRKIWYGESLDITLWHPDRAPIRLSS